MIQSRRQFAGFLAAATGLVFSRTSQAATLIGQWVVRCDCGRDETVRNVTREHACYCGRQTVARNPVRVVCPNGHVNEVSGFTTQHECQQPECRAQCERAHIPIGVSIPIYSFGRGPGRARD